jgi:hypothetical protein
LWWPLALVLLAALALLMLYWIPRQSRPRVRLAVALPAFGLLLCSIGCGSTGQNTVTTGQGGTPAGSYTLTISSSGGGQSHTSTVTVVVK